MNKNEALERAKYYNKKLDIVNNEILDIREQMKSGNRTNEFQLLILNTEKKVLEELAREGDTQEKYTSIISRSIPTTERVVYELMNTRNGFKLLDGVLKVKRKPDEFTEVKNYIELPEKTFPMLRKRLITTFGKEKGTLELDDTDTNRFDKMVKSVRSKFDELVFMNINPLTYERLYSLLNLDLTNYSDVLRVYTDLAYYIDVQDYNQYRKLFRDLNRVQSSKLAMFKQNEIESIKDSLEELGLKIGQDLTNTILNIFHEYRICYGVIYSGDTSLYNIVKYRQLFTMDIKRVDRVLSSLENNIKNRRVKCLSYALEDSEYTELINKAISQVLGYEVTEFDPSSIKRFETGDIYKRVYLHDTIKEAYDYENGYTLIK